MKQKTALSSKHLPTKVALKSSNNLSEKHNSMNESNIIPSVAPLINLPLHLQGVAPLINLRPHLQGVAPLINLCPHLQGVAPYNYKLLILS